MSIFSMLKRYIVLFFIIGTTFIMTGCAYKKAYDVSDLKQGKSIIHNKSKFVLDVIHHSGKLEELRGIPEKSLAIYAKMNKQKFNDYGDYLFLRIKKQKGNTPLFKYGSLLSIDVDEQEYRTFAIFVNNFEEYQYKNEVKVKGIDLVSAILSLAANTLTGSSKIYTNSLYDTVAWFPINKDIFYLLAHTDDTFKITTKAVVGEKCTVLEFTKDNVSEFRKSYNNIYSE